MTAKQKQLPPSVKSKSSYEKMPTFNVLLSVPGMTTAVLKDGNDNIIVGTDTNYDNSGKW